MQHLQDCIARGRATIHEVTSARKRAGLTQVEAAKLIHVGSNTWSCYERGERAMRPAAFELFLRKTGQY